MSDKPTAVNDITGDEIRSKPVNDKYAENWERIFGSKDLYVMASEEEKSMNEALLESGKTINPPSLVAAWMVIMKGGDGPIVGAWWDRETAEDVCSKQPKSHNNVVRKVLIVEE